MAASDPSAPTPRVHPCQTPNLTQQVTSSPGSRDLTGRWANRPRKSDRAELRDPEPLLCGTAPTLEEQEPLRGPPSPTRSWPPRSLPRARAQAACPSATLALARTTQPSPEGLTRRVGQQWPQGRRASTPERPGPPSAVPSAHPPGSVKAPDEIIPLGPQGGQKALQSSTSSRLRSKDSGHSSGARGTPRLHPFTETLRPRSGLGQPLVPQRVHSWAGRDSGLLSPSPELGLA